MSTMRVHRRTVGDTRTPLYSTLMQEDTDGVLQPVDLSALVGKFCMVSEAGVTKIVLAATGVSNHDAANGIIKKTFADGEVDEAGTFYGWFIVEDLANDEDTFPHDGRFFKIIFVAAEGRS